MFWCIESVLCNNRLLSQQTKRIRCGLDNAAETYMFGWMTIFLLVEQKKSYLKPELNLRNFRVKQEIVENSQLILTTYEAHHQFPAENLIDKVQIDEVKNEETIMLKHVAG